MQQITGNVYAETRSKGANTGFVTTTEGVVMIDTPHRPSDSLKWREEISKTGVVSYIINTEPHIDHFTGNYFFPGVVVSQEETRETIAHFPLERVKERVNAIDPGEMLLMEDYQVRVPTLTFSERLSLYLGDHAFELVHLPGHTSGQLAVRIPSEGVLFTGDTVSCRVQLFMHDSDPFQWLQSIKRIEKMDVDIIVPGHGDVCDRSYLPELSSFIEEWIDTVRKAVEQGLSKEEAMDRISLLDRYPMDLEMEAMGPTVQRWNVARLYDLLSAPR